MPNVLVTAPTAAAISTTDAKLFLRVDADTEDDMIDSFVSAATEYGQRYLDRQFITATRREEMDNFPSGDVIALPYGPLATVTHVKYYNTSNVLTTLAAASYVLDTSRLPGRIVLAEGYSWPWTYDRPNAVQITYTCGYGDADDVPANIIVGLKQLVHAYYTDRSASGTGTPSADALLGLSTDGRMT